MLLSAPGTAPDAPFTSSLVSRFTFVDDPLNSTEAEAYCQLLGGHLASYLSLDEQVGRRVLQLKPSLHVCYCC
jgi:hypothetical protein